MTTSISAQNSLDSDGKKHGFWKTYYPSGKLKSDGSYKNGIPVGVFKYYYEENGKIKIILKHKGDGLNAYAEVLNENGVKVSEGNYKSEKKDGEWKYFHPNGNLSIKETWKDGKKNGITYKYYPNGNVLEQFEYKDDVKNGIWKQFFSDGVIKADGVYINGKLNGKARFYHPNGKVEFEGEYIEDFKEGDWIKLDPYGRLLKKIEFRRGNPTDENILIQQELEPIKVKGYE
jgi:antitoxin component YwqK of YwqJK toxin-antitoxin module